MKRKLDRLSQPTASRLFGGILFLVVEATELLVNHSIMNVHGVIVVCKWLGIRISSQCKPLPIASTLRRILLDSIPNVTVL